MPSMVNARAAPTLITLACRDLFSDGDESYTGVEPNAREP
jgi:hypothetical protein